MAINLSIDSDGTAEGTKVWRTDTIGPGDIELTSIMRTVNERNGATSILYGTGDPVITQVMIVLTDGMANQAAASEETTNE